MIGYNMRRDKNMKLNKMEYWRKTVSKYHHSVGNDRTKCRTATLSFLLKQSKILSLILLWFIGFFSSSSVVSDVCFWSLVVMMKFTHYRLWRFSTTALPSLFLDICVRKKPNLRSSSTAYLESTQITAQTKPQMNHQFNQLGQYLRHQYAPTPLNDDIPRLKPTHFNRNENRNAYILYKCVRLSFCLSFIKQELFFITILIATMRIHKNCNLIYFFES